MKWFLVAIMYMSPNMSVDPEISVNNQVLFPTEIMCKAFVVESKLELRNELIEHFPKVKHFTLACVNGQALIELHKKYKKNEI
tara:strand:- start:569 stop:817 length:249 start_codon:yes stop_codon:yes gene_type:complete